MTDTSHGSIATRESTRFDDVKNAERHAYGGAADERIANGNERVGPVIGTHVDSARALAVRRPGAACRARRTPRTRNTSLLATLLPILLANFLTALLLPHRVRRRMTSRCGAPDTRRARQGRRPVRGQSATFGDGPGLEIAFASSGSRASPADDTADTKHTPPRYSPHRVEVSVMVVERFAELAPHRRSSSRPGPRARRRRAASSIAVGGRTRRAEGRLRGARSGPPWSPRKHTGAGLASRRRTLRLHARRTPTFLARSPLHSVLSSRTVYSCEAEHAAGLHLQSRHLTSRASGQRLYGRDTSPDRLPCRPRRPRLPRSSIRGRTTASGSPTRHLRGPRPGPASRTLSNARGRLARCGPSSRPKPVSRSGGGPLRTRCPRPANMTNDVAARRREHAASARRTLAALGASLYAGAGRIDRYLTYEADVPLTVLSRAADAISREPPMRPSGV